MINTLRFLLCLLLITTAGSDTTILHGQYLISSESLGTRSTAQLEAELGQPVRTGVSLYKLTYMTRDVHDMVDTASGLLVLPDMSLNDALPMVVYQHGTTNGPMDVPSRLAAGSSESMAYGAMGYVTVAADYLGLGDSEGIHPYVHAESQASAALDMIFAVTEWFEVMTGEGWVGDLFVSGYSQGGHAAAALQKELEDNWSLVYPVTASTPMSGPYSLSGVMYERIISDDIYFTPAYIAYITLAYQEVYGNLYVDLEDLFKPAYIPAIEDFRDDMITTTFMNILLVNQLFLEVGASRPKVMFKDSVLQSIIANEDHPFKVALRANDLYDWAPQVPTRLYYCTNDEQVPYQNSLVADSVMRENGAPDVAAINFGPLSHGGCATPAIEASIEFFDSFILASSVQSVDKIQYKTVVRPNPATDHLHLLPEFADQIAELTITDVSGRSHVTHEVHHSRPVDISGLPPGLYVVHGRYEGGSFFQKIVVTDP